MKKYDNFCAALKNLEDIFLYKEPYDNVTITGLVGLYEICLDGHIIIRLLVEKNIF